MTIEDEGFISDRKADGDDGFFGFLSASGISVAECAVSADLTQELFPQERACLTLSVPKRRREFSTGRVLARRALAALDTAPLEIPRGASREPVWPVDIVGSITHSDTWCSVAIGRRSSELSSIGIDLEPMDALPADLIPAICCSSSEMEMLAALHGEQRGLAARCVFSAKESFYKAQFPASRQLLQMHDVSIELALDTEVFRVQLLVDAAPFTKGQTFDGDIRRGRGHIATAVRMRMDFPNVP